MQSIHNDCESLESGSITLDESGIDIEYEGNESDDVSFNESGVSEGPKSDVPNILELVVPYLSNQMVEFSLSTLITENWT